MIQYKLSSASLPHDWVCMCGHLRMHTLKAVFKMLYKEHYNTCHIHLFIHTFMHWWQRPPFKVPTCSSGPAIHTNTHNTAETAKLEFLPRVRDQTTDLRISGPPTLPSEPQPAVLCIVYAMFSCSISLISLSRSHPIKLWSLDMFDQFYIIYIICNQYSWSCYIFYIYLLPYIFKRKYGIKQKRL